MEYLFYSIFFFVPLFFLGNTSELFEFNKLWLTFILTILIGMLWFSKMIIEKRLLIRKTPLDIPIVLFLVSQAISTIFSLDSHVSLWGYYSRFNGGLLSILAYIFLYYAFVSNLNIKHVIRSIYIIIASGIVTVLWGLPSHFGYDMTCYVFRGTLDTSCWTDAFKPTIRIFSTLGQPAWFAAYLDVILIILMGFSLFYVKRRNNKLFTLFLALSILFYVSLIFANTRAGNLAFYIGDILFWITVFYKKIIERLVVFKYFVIFHVAFVICNFFFGFPISSLEKYTFPEIQKQLIVYAAEDTENKNAEKETGGITDSSDIRLVVWRGAIEAWKANPIFGTGVETFAFAYYKYRPVEHNLTSEWDFLYNKAHNEYLNYLTTTGLVGIITYFSFIFGFIIISISYIFRVKTNSKNEEVDRVKYNLLIISILFSFVTILITNFFGFSVVIINIFLFILPLFSFILMGRIKPDRNYVLGSVNTKQKYNKMDDVDIGLYQWILIVLVGLIGLYMIFGLFRYWYADAQYALGYNLDRTNNYEQALPLLQDASNTMPSEPVYLDELAVNLGALAGALYLQNDKPTADALAKNAIELDNKVIENHPNNVIFWKNRLRIFYILANSSNENQAIFLREGLAAIQKASDLAPTDAKIAYNLGVVTSDTGNLEEAVRILERTINLKPNYYDAYVALGKIYQELATNEDAVPNSSEERRKIWNQKAIETYEFILKNLSPNNPEMEKAIKDLQEG